MIKAKKTKLALFIAAFLLIVSCFFGVLTLKNEKVAKAEETISVTQVQFRTNTEDTEYYFFLRMAGQTDYTTANQTQDPSFINNTNLLDKVTVYFLNGSATLRELWNGTRVDTYKWGDDHTLAFQMKEGYKAIDGIGARIAEGAEIPMVGGGVKVTSESRSFWQQGTGKDMAINQYTVGFETIPVGLTSVSLRKSDGYMHLTVRLGEGNDWVGAGEGLPTQAKDAYGSTSHANASWRKTYLANFTSKIKLHVKETNTWVNYGSIIIADPSPQWFMVYNGWGEADGMIRLRIQNEYTGLTIDKVMFEKGCELPSYEFNGNNTAHKVHLLDAEYVATVAGTPSADSSMEWTYEKRCEVTFNGGNSVWVKAGEKIAFPTELSQTKPEDDDNKYVYNWFNGTQLYDFDTPVTTHLDLTSDGSFTAIPKIKYTLSFANGEETITPITVVYGEAIGTLPAVTEKAGYDGVWTLNGVEIDATTVWKLMDNATATVLYTPKTYTLSFSNGEEVIDPITVTFGEKIGSMPSITEKANHNGAWQVNGETLTSASVWSIADNATAVATYSLVNRTVTFDGGAAVQVVHGGKVEKPADPTKEATAECNYVFDGWYLGDKKWDFATDVVEGNINLCAKFNEEMRKYTITFVIKGKDGLTLAPVEAEYGSAYDLTALFEGQDLSGYLYSAVVNGVERATVKVSGDTTVEIVFTEYVETSDEGCSGSIAASAVLTLLAAGVALCYKKKEN